MKDSVKETLKRLGISLTKETDKGTYMKKKEIRKALEGGTPFSSLYSLLPSGQKEKFKQFAAAFGFTERQVRERLRKETR